MTVRLADQPRGPEKYPHWHDAPAWAKRTTMTRSRFLAMTPDEFYAWVVSSGQDAEAFFYGIRWVEGHHYCHDRGFATKTAYPGLKKNRDNWPTILLDCEE